MYQKGDPIELVISDAAEGGKCFGRLAEGLGVFVRGTLAPGDRVEAEIRKVKRSFLEAGLIRVLEPSPARTSPVCSHFGLCGGCKWQHVTYEEQLLIKQKAVRDVLTHVGGFADPPVDAVVPAAAPLGYRNKMDFSFADRRYLSPEELASDDAETAKSADFALGFHAPRNYRKAIDIDYCHLATPETNQVLQTVRAFCLEQGLSVYSTVRHQGYLRNLVVRHARVTGELMVNLVTTWHEEQYVRELDERLRAVLGDGLTTFVNGITDRKSLVAFGDREVVVSGPGHILERLGPFTFRISANSFFQTHTEQALRLYEEIMNLSEPGPQDVVYDLYCGTGSISFFLARRTGRVLGMEAIDAAVADAEENARRNEVTNCTFRRIDLRSLGKICDELEAFGRPEVVVTDPPRAGMHPKAVSALRDLAPSRIVYVSCKPASLARDAQLLCQDGAYRLARVRPVDMFPQTSHVEAVALLER